MMIFIVTFALFLLLVAAMSIGYIVQRKRIHGSCGRIAALGLEKVCNCPEPCEARKARERAARQQEQRII